MGIIIDHEARKRDIIAKAINLFAEQGYNGVTYQKIADNCNIARTTLYKYFRNKREIFSTAIWEVSNLMIDSYAEILPSKTSVVDRLNREFTAAMSKPEVATVVERQAFALTGSTPARLGAFMKEQLESYRATLKAAGVEPE